MNYIQPTMNYSNNRGIDFCFYQLYTILTMSHVYRLVDRKLRLNSTVNYVHNVYLTDINVEYAEYCLSASVSVPAEGRGRAVHLKIFIAQVKKRYSSIISTSHTIFFFVNWAYCTLFKLCYLLLLPRNGDYYIH